MQYINLLKILIKKIIQSIFLIIIYIHLSICVQQDCSQKKSVNEIISTLNTNKIDTNKGYYDNYICSIKRTFEFIKYLEENDKDAAVIFEVMENILQKIIKMKSAIFNLVKKSNNCSNKISNEIDNINAVRYLLIVQLI